MHFIENNLVRVGNLIESSDKGQDRQDGHGQPVVPFRLRLRSHAAPLTSNRGRGGIVHHGLFLSASLAERRVRRHDQIEASIQVL